MEDKLPEVKPVHVYGFGYLYDDEKTQKRYKEWCEALAEHGYKPDEWWKVEEDNKVVDTLDVEPSKPVPEEVMRKIIRPIDKDTREKVTVIVDGDKVKVEIKD